VNIPPNGFLKIDAPVTGYYRIIDVAEGFLNKRQYDGAIANFRKALALHPEEPMVHNSLGVALARAGDPDQAARHYRQAIAISADYPDPHSNLGAVLLSKARLDEAVSELEQAIRLNPEYGEAFSNLGAALAQQGRLDPAIPNLRKAVEYGRQDANARRTLGLALLLADKVGEALPQAEEAVKLSRSQDPSMLGLLGMIYAEAGRLADAVRVTRQALALASRRNEQALVQKMQQRLASYQAVAPAAKR
jgi:superkiller protein 3